MRVYRGEPSLVRGIPYCDPLPAVDADGGMALVDAGFGALAGAAGAVAGAAGGGVAGACTLAALLGAPEEGVISPLLPHADNASVAATNSPAVTKPFIYEVSVAGFGASAALLQLTFHFHGEIVIPRSHIDPTQAFVDIPDSLHEDALNIVAPKATT